MVDAMEKQEKNNHLVSMKRLSNSTGTSQDLLDIFSLLNFKVRPSLYFDLLPLDVLNILLTYLSLDCPLIILPIKAVSAQLDSHGERLVTSSNDGTASIWSIKTKSLLSSFAGHNAGVNSARFNPQNTQIVTASKDCTAKLWAVARGLIIHTFKGHCKSVNDAEFNAQGSQVITASDDGTAKVWDASTGCLLRTLADPIKLPLKSAQFNLQGTSIITAPGKKGATLWDVDELSHIGDGCLFTDFARFSPDNTLIILTETTLGIASLWNIEKNKTEKIFDHSTFEQARTINYAEFSPQGAQIVTSGENGFVKVWDVKTGSLITSFSHPDHAIKSAHYDYTGSIIVTVCSDDTIRVWLVQPNVKEIIELIQKNYDT